MTDLPILTMEDVAKRLDLPRSTLYQYIADLERQFPGVAWYRKRGRHRRFTEQDVQRLAEAIWPSSSIPREPAKATPVGTPGSTGTAKSSRSQTGARDEAEARRAARRAELRLLTGAPAKDQDRALVNFAEAVEIYKQARRPSKNDERYIDKLLAHFCRRPVAEIRSKDIAVAATTLYPKARNETLNRQVYTPMAAILHYAAENELCPYIVIRKLPEREPERRRPSDAEIAVLMKKTSGRLNRLLVFLFYQGWRISEALSLEWENVDLERLTLKLYVSKARTWKTIAMHEEVAKALARVPRPFRNGRVWTYGDRHNVYRELRPICKALGVHFTPHMARHWFGSQLNAMNTTARDIMNAGSWTSEKGVAPYTKTDLERGREVVGRLSISSGNRGTKRGRQSK